MKSENHVTECVFGSWSLEGRSYRKHLMVDAMKT